MLRFTNFFKLAEVVFVIPHSNVEFESIVIIVREKNDVGYALKLDVTLSSVLAVKSRYPKSYVPCYQWKPDDTTISKARSTKVKSLKKT